MSRRPVQTFPADLFAQRVAAGDKNGEQIGHRRAGDEYAGGLARKSEEFREPKRDLPLNIDGDMIAAAAIGIQSRRQHFRHHADRRARALHPAHKERMNIASGIRQDRMREVVEQVGEFAALARQRRLEARLDLVRDRLPDFLLPQSAQMLDHEIERRMRLGAKASQSSGSRSADGASRPLGGTLNC